MWHETELVADGEGLVMTENDDNRRLRCVASVDGLLPNVTVTTVAVRCQSLIHRLYTDHMHSYFYFSLSAEMFYLTLFYQPGQFTPISVMLKLYFMFVLWC